MKSIIKLLVATLVSAAEVKDKSRINCFGDPWG
jgi:hypothetical protein